MIAFVDHSKDTYSKIKKLLEETDEDFICLGNYRMENVLKYINLCKKYKDRLILLSREYYNFLEIRPYKNSKMLCKQYFKRCYFDQKTNILFTESIIFRRRLKVVCKHSPYFLSLNNHQQENILDFNIESDGQIIANVINDSEFDFNELNNSFLDYRNEEYFQKKGIQVSKYSYCDVTFDYSSDCSLVLVSKSKHF
jgi:hypothetical protein